jgi:hypothetical protein
MRRRDVLAAPVLSGCGLASPGPVRAQAKMVRVGVVPPAELARTAPVWVAFERVFFQQIELSQKRLQLVRDAFPQAQAAAVLWDRAAADQWQATQNAAAALGFRLTGIELRAPPCDHERALAGAGIDGDGPTREVCCRTARASTACSGVLPITSTALRAAPDRRTCRSSSRPNSSWWSISEPQGDRSGDPAGDPAAR